jgi:hydrogenase expression/formation protein HypC
MSPPDMSPLEQPRVPECAAEVCITCSDQAVQVSIVALLGDQMASVDTGSGRETVSVALVDARVGDTVLVHAGEAIARLSRNAAS